VGKLRFYTILTPFREIAHRGEISHRIGTARGPKGKKGREVRGEGEGRGKLALGARPAAPCRAIFRGTLAAGPSPRQVCFLHSMRKAALRLTMVAYRFPPVRLAAAAAASPGQTFGSQGSSTSCGHAALLRVQPRVPQAALAALRSPPQLAAAQPWAAWGLCRRPSLWSSAWRSPAAQLLTAGSTLLCEGSAACGGWSRSLQRDRTPCTQVGSTTALARAWVLRPFIRNGTYDIDGLKGLGHLRACAKAAPSPPCYTCLSPKPSSAF
jgi:hypothetical protein